MAGWIGGYWNYERCKHPKRPVPVKTDLGRIWLCDCGAKWEVISVADSANYSQQSIIKPIPPHAEVWWRKIR